MASPGPPSTTGGTTTAGVPLPHARVDAASAAVSATMARTSAPPARHRAIDLPLALTLLRVIPLVPLLLAVHERELGLDAALLLVQRQRHESVPLLLDLAREAIDLAAVQQQFAPAPRLVVAPVRVRVEADVDLVQPGLVLGDLGEGVDHRDLAFADRL